MISITTPQQILKHQLNDSLAKYHWSFGKGHRFSQKKPNCDAYYQIPTTRSKRSTSFGSGKRTSFVLTVDSPSPMLYNRNSSFDKDAVLRGTSFGKGRSECPEQGYIPTGAVKNPGPGTYNFPKNKSVNYSMRPKTAYPNNYFITDREKSLTPGPGSYEDVLKTNPHGYLTSRVKNPKRVTLGFKDKRFTDSSTLVPGPGHYNDRNFMSKDGKYMLSTNRSDGKRSFMYDKRELYLQGNRYTPGPGYYRMPSDFGHYEKVPYQTLQPNSTPKQKRPMTARR